MCAIDTHQLTKDIEMIVDRAYTTRELPYVSKDEVTEFLVAQLVQFLRTKKAHYEELQEKVVV